jgi:hypothetical protein
MKDNAQSRSPIGKKSKVARNPAPVIVESPIVKDVKLEGNSTAVIVSTSVPAGKQKESGSKKSASNNNNKAQFQIDQCVLGHSQKYNQLFDAKVLMKRYDEQEFGHIKFDVCRS